MAIDPRTNLSTDLLNQVNQQGMMPGGWYVEGLMGGQQPIDGRYYSAVHDQSSFGQGEEAGMLMNPTAKPIQYHGYDESWADGGKHQGEFGQVYDSEGKYLQDYAWKDDDAKKNLMLMLAAAGGMAMLPGGAFSGATGGGAGAGAGAGAGTGGGAAAGGAATGGGLSIPGIGSISGGNLLNIVKAAAGIAGGAGAGGGGGGGSIGSGVDDGGGGGMDLSTIIKLLGGGWDYKNQNDASKDMLDWLKSRQEMNDNMYKPGSDEYNALWNEMSRKDAAAGRNSQYGPRSVDLAAKIAGLKMDANTRMTTGIGNFMANAMNKKAAAPAGLISSLNDIMGGGGSGGGLMDILRKLGSGTAGGDWGIDPSQIDFGDAGWEQILNDFPGDWGPDPSDIVFEGDFDWSDFL
jgi:hypothetical protein